MRKRRPYWKALTHDRKSCVVIDPRWVQHYPKGVEVGPVREETRLYVFRRWKDARAFSNDGLIVPCYAKNPRREALDMPFPRTRLLDLRIFWFAYSLPKPLRTQLQFMVGATRAPIGTYTCDAITCLE